MKKFYFVFFLLFTATICFAQSYQITGKVTDLNGVPIPFASIFIKNSTKGVSANGEGMYKISIANATATLVFRAIGYTSVEKNISANANLVLDISLTPEVYTLNNVVIRGNAEDPAYEIIRNAIKNRTKHLTEIESFRANVYIKGVQKLVDAPKKFLGQNIQQMFDLDTTGNGIIYLSESQSVFSFKRPNKINEQMLSSRVSGRNNAFSFNKASDLVVNFYENLMFEGSGLGSRAFISPIADNALFYYRYRLLGVSIENGISINKIEVIPRRKSDPVFRGTIYIAENSWRLISADLDLTKDAGINLIDTLNTQQQFIKVGDFYVPSDIKFQFKGNVLGFGFDGYFVGIFSDFEINPSFPKNHFTGEILKITKEVNQKDSLFWEENRPLPLTLEEINDYQRKDSIAVLRESKPYLDSIDRDRNAFSIGKILIRGYTINRTFEKKFIRFDPLLPALHYNTVEGFAIKYGVNYRVNMADRKYFSLRPEMRYGLSNKIFTAKLSANYFYNPIKRANFSWSFGTEIADLNPLNSMSLLGNSLNTLLFETNYSKFYKRDFFQITTSRELANGLQANAKIDYSNNSTLSNTSDVKFFENRSSFFTSNNPFTPNTDFSLFPTYKDLSLSLNFSYTIAQKYISRPDGKFYEESKYPRINVGYRKGINKLFGSEVDYDFLNVEISQNRIRLGLVGYSSFSVGVGKFLNTTNIFYPNFNHFKGNKSTVLVPEVGRFRYLNFYVNSTDKQYFEGHFEHNFAGFLTNKIPLLRKLNLEEYIGVNYLSQPLKRNYSELYFGIKRFVFNVSYGFSFDDSGKLGQGFRLSYRL